MNLSEWAETQGINKVTAYRWFKDGKLPVSARKIGGLILVEPNGATAPTGPHKTVIYARVSSSDQQADLERQVARIATWATGQGMSVDQVVTEVGSALNGHRRKFLALLKDRSVTRIVVEHRDRFARFATEYIEAALSAQGRELVVVDTAEVDDDLVRDINAAKNLRDWPETKNASLGSVGSEAPVDTQAACVGDTDPGPDRGSSTTGRAHVRPCSTAMRGEARINTPRGEAVG